MKTRVLFVEDAVDDALLVQTFFASAPEFAVTHTQDGDQALELLERGTWDLLVADLNVPGTNGFEVIRAARTGSRHLPILAITGYTQEHYWDQAFRAGADQVMVKPLDREDFLAHVRAQRRGRPNPAAAASGATPPRAATAPAEREPVRPHGAAKGTVLIAEGLLGDGIMGCGGTALRMVDSGARVLVLPLLPDPASVDAAELEAAKHAARLLGIGFKVADVLVSAPGRGPEVLDRIMGELGPSTVYAPAPGDGHPARAAAARAVLAAARGRARVLGYQTATSAAGFAPARFVDIAATLPAKVEALGAFGSLVGTRRDLDPELAHAYARYWGRFKDFSEVEAFELIQENA